MPVFDFLKNEEPGVGNAGFENCNLLKPALGMPASKFVITETGDGNVGFATCTKRTTLVKFLKLDVYYGFFIFSELHPYKTPTFVYVHDNN